MTDVEEEVAFIDFMNLLAATFARFDRKHPVPRKAPILLFEEFVDR